MVICFGYAFYIQEYFSNIVLSTAAFMRGFNNDDLDKFEKATKNITSKYVKMPKNPLFKNRPKIKTQIWQLFYYLVCLVRLIVSINTTNIEPSIMWISMNGSRELLRINGQICHQDIKTELY